MSISLIESKKSSKYLNVRDKYYQVNEAQTTKMSDMLSVLKSTQDKCQNDLETSAGFIRPGSVILASK